jgi:hypothetical protein
VEFTEFSRRVVVTFNNNVFNVRTKAIRRLGELFLSQQHPEMLPRVRDYMSLRTSAEESWARTLKIGGNYYSELAGEEILKLPTYV